VQKVLVLTVLFDYLVSSAEREVRNSFFPSVCSNLTQKFVSQTQYYQNLYARKRFIIASSYLAFAAFCVPPESRKELVLEFANICPLSMTFLFVKYSSFTQLLEPWLILFRLLSLSTVEDYAFPQIPPFPVNLLSYRNIRKSLL